MNPPASMTPIMLDQHALITGINGSGKSTRLTLQASWRLQRMRKFSPRSWKMVIVDSKPIQYGENDDYGHYWKLGDVIYRDWRRFTLENDYRCVIYRPTADLVNPTDFGQFFDKLRDYRRKDPHGNLAPLPMTIIIDELIDIIASQRSRRTYIESFTKFLTEGRGALQTLWIATQYPTYIDAGIKRNARVNFVFRLPDGNDRKIMAAVLGSRLLEQPIRYKHGFFYQNDAFDQTLTVPEFFNGIVNAA